MSGRFVIIALSKFRHKLKTLGLHPALFINKSYLSILFVFHQRTQISSEVNILSTQIGQCTNVKRKTQLYCVNVKENNNDRSTCFVNSLRSAQFLTGLKTS